jgi:hypothetical protein
MTEEDTAVCAVVNCMACELAITTELLVVMIFVQYM